MTLRRMELFPFVLSGILVVGFAVALVVNWPVPPVLIGAVGCVFAGVVAYAYLDGPAVSLTVAPDLVVVTNTFVRYEVPRHLIRNVDELDRLALRLDLGNRRIPVRVWEPALVPPTYRSRRAQAARTDAIHRLFDAVPAGAGGGAGTRTEAVSRRMRASSVAIAAAPVTGLLVVFVLAHR